MKGEYIVNDDLKLMKLWRNDKKCCINMMLKFMHAAEVVIKIGVTENDNRKYISDTMISNDNSDIQNLQMIS